MLKTIIKQHLPREREKGEGREKEVLVLTTTTLCSEELIYFKQRDVSCNFKLPTSSESDLGFKCTQVKVRKWGNRAYFCKGHTARCWFSFIFFIFFLFVVDFVIH